MSSEIILVQVRCKDCNKSIFDVLSDRKKPENAVCQDCAKHYRKGGMMK